MKEIPILPRCKELLEKREYVLIGISPFNSYFSEETIKKLIYWGHKKVMMCPSSYPLCGYVMILS